MILRSIALMALCLAGAGEARAQRLFGQRVQGLERVCVYGTPPRVRETRVGVGEPCPPTFRLRVEEPARVPALATLLREQRGATRTECIYGLDGREYVQVRGNGSACTYTPSR